MSKNRNDSTVQEFDPNETTSVADLPLWRVSLELRSEHKAEDRTLSGYMDQPRIFRCERQYAEPLFKLYYSIRSTEYMIQVKAASEEEYELQQRLDSRKPMRPKPTPQQAAAAGIPQEVLMAAWTRLADAMEKLAAKG